MVGRADLEPQKPKAGDDNGHDWAFDLERYVERDTQKHGTCLYCGCAQTSPEAQILCRNIGSDAFWRRL